jgi:hypothetical protein
MIDTNKILAEIDSALDEATWENGPPVHDTRSYQGKTETGWAFLVVAWIASRDRDQTNARYGFAGTASRIAEGLIVKLTPELAEKAARLAKAKVS